jgi:hypothetical protein
MRPTALIATLGVLVAVLASCAGPTPSSETGTVLQTAWGDPNLQGTWFVLESVPLQRSADNAGVEFLTDEQVAAEDAEKSINPGRNARSDDSSQDVTGAYNAVFNSVLRTSNRTSMIINPTDGRIPPLVGAEQGGGGGRGGRGGRGFGPVEGQNDNPETTAQSPRCLGVQAQFLPLNTAFAQGTVLQIIQSPHSIGIYLEDDHAGGSNRVIFMDDRPHVAANVRNFLGDARGHWEGDTLVIETTNFSQGFRGSNPNTLRMVERFTRVGPNDLRREVTFEDPQTWTEPWTVLIEMGKGSDERHMIYDSTCHEGNYGMTGILIGARMDEQNAQ